MDDDDSGLLDFIGDPQALNYFLHGTSNTSAGEELASADYSSNSNSIFANSNKTDPKPSIKDVHNEMGEGTNDGIQLSNSLQFLDEELESSPIHDLNEDILQKSLNLANITAQTLANEAYLDANIGPNQHFSNVPLHSHTSASFPQDSNVPNHSGQTLHSVQQQVSTSLASNTLGVQHSFMQHVGINIPSQHMSDINHSGSGQIHLISSLNSPSSLMAISNPDGSQIILKNGQQTSGNTTGGMLVHRQTPNGNAVFGNSSPPGQSVSVPFNNGNFQTSLPVHNIIIHRPQNTNKFPINIQPKPVQVGQQTSYNMNNFGIQQHHIQQNVQFVHGNPQNSTVGQQMHVNIASQQGPRKPGAQQTGGSIVIHSAMGQPHGHASQLLIPTGLSVNSNSMQHVHTINAQLVHTQPSHLGLNQVSADHLMLNRNTNMVRTNQSYSTQMLNSPNTAVQLVHGQHLTGHGGQVIVNQAASHLVGGQIQQVSPTVVHLSPGQGNAVPNRSNFTSVSSGGQDMSAPNRFTVVNSGTVLQNVVSSFQPSSGGERFVGDLQTRTSCTMSDSLPNASSSAFCPTSGSQQMFSNMQKNVMNHLSPVSSIKTQDNSRQPQFTTALSNSTLTGHHSGGNLLHHTIALSQPQEKIIESLLPNLEGEGQSQGLKRQASKQLTKGSLILQQLHKDQEHSVLHDKVQFRSFNNAVQRLLPYHIFQGSLPNEEDLQKVDDEFEVVATHILKKTQSMLNKYRQLLLEDAMRITPSAEMVMLDRIFNQEERAILTREKRLALVDPDGYLADFCCASICHEKSVDGQQFSNDMDTHKYMINPCRTVCTQKDQTELNVSKKPGDICAVPNNNVTSEKVNVSSLKNEGLNADGKLRKTSCSPINQLLKICETKGKSDENNTPFASESGTICKTSKPTDNRTSPNLGEALFKSNLLLVEDKHLQEKSPKPSPENSGSAESSGSPCRHVVIGSKASQPTLKNVSDLELSGKHLENTVSTSTLAELECHKDSSASSPENSTDKTISDASEGSLETDSVLEAAVNSILEC